MRPAFMKKYFSSREEKEVEDEQLKAELGKWYRFTRCEGYKEFRRWLNDQLAESDIEAGEYEQMLAQVGVRKGIRLVQVKLRQIERSCRGYTDE